MNNKHNTGKLNCNFTFYKQSLEFFTYKNGKCHSSLSSQLSSHLHITNNVTPCTDSTSQLQQLPEMSVLGFVV